MAGQRWCKARWLLACHRQRHAALARAGRDRGRDRSRIRSLRLDALRRQWRLVFGRVPPAGLSKDLLGRMMAARLQERAFGGLDRDSLRFLESLARHGRPPRRQLKPGTMLVREYQAGATSSRPSVTASSGRERHIPASQRSHAPSPARPGVGLESQTTHRIQYVLGQTLSTRAKPPPGGPVVRWRHRFQARCSRALASFLHRRRGQVPSVSGSASESGKARRG